MPKTEFTILVVDDVSDWRMTLSGLLTDEGYKVETAGSTAEALELLKDGHFDLAILDLRLNEADESNIEGFNLAVEIKRHWPDVRIILMTGYADISIVVRALKTDDQGHHLAEDFIMKGEVEDLLAIVHRLREEQR